MNYGDGRVAGSGEPRQEMPVAPQLVEQMDKNLSNLWSSIDLIENRCHAILNQRTPIAEEKSPTPLENDFIQQMANRLISFSKANEKLQQIVEHLSKIV